VSHKKRTSKREAKNVRAVEESYQDSIIQKVKDLIRVENMQEFVEVPSDRELVLLTDKAITELNTTSPMTPDFTLEKWLSTSDTSMLLTKMLLCNMIELILADYAHKGIDAHSIEDIQVSDRSERYQALYDRCDKEGLKENVSNYKVSKGLGVEAEEKLAKGVVRSVKQVGYDDRLIASSYSSSRFGITSRCGITKIRW
jgi:hypothetical protein